jgi:hypothetical protein
MKNFKKISMIVALIGVTFLLGLTSCTKDNPIEPTYDETFNYVSYGTFVEEIQLSSPTLESDFQILNEMTPQVVENGALFAGKIPMLPFREIFKMLNLTEEQKAEFKRIMLAHIDCERAARMAYFEAISEILNKARAERIAIKEKVKNGEIVDRKEAGKLLRELEIRTKKAIAESGAVKELRIALKGCTDEMIVKIKAILDAEQLAKFEKWLKRKIGGSKDPGTGTGTGTRP